MKLRKGFTLVELLIVIVIIGVLAAAMLLASGAATASAEASNIVSNLRSLQSASLMFFADNMDELMDPNSGVTFDIDDLVQYTNNPDAPVWAAYTFTFGLGGGGVAPLADESWWISAPVTRTDVGTRLQGRAASVGLFNDDTDTASTNWYTGGVGQVFMLVRNP